MLTSLSKLYGKVVARRNTKFDSGKTKTVKVTVPVISVGNVSVGGTGKTPMVGLLVELLKANNRKPAIIMRGYKRSSRGIVVAHDGNAIVSTAREVGDEAMVHARRCNVPVVVGENKVDTAVHTAGFLPCDVIVVDDGFQHRWLHRDLDVVLVDKATVDDQLLLPAGRLREPLTSLSRAHIVALVGGVDRSNIEPFIADSTVVVEANVVADVSMIQHKRVVAFCGIAQPQRFSNTLQLNGIEPDHVIEFADHHVYTKSDVEKIIALAKQVGLSVVTTEKDIVKLEHARAMFTDAGVELYVVPITMQITSGLHLLEELVDITLRNFER